MAEPFPPAGAPPQDNPYAAPATTPKGYRPRRGGPPAAFASARPRMIALLVLLGALLVSEVAVALGYLDLRSLAQRALTPGSGVTAADGEAIDASNGRRAVALLGLLALCAAAWWTWLHRIVRNMRPLRGPETYTPAWACWSYVVPFVNLVVPYQAMQSAWRWSDPVAARRLLGVEAGRRPPSSVGAGGALVVAWWAGWLVTGIFQRIAQMVLGGSSNAESVRDACVFLVAGEGLLIATTLVAMALVWQLTVRQERRRAVLGEAPANAAGEVP
jgi:hypothetical protein